MGLFDRVRGFFRTEDGLPRQETGQAVEAEGQDGQYLEAPAPDVPAAGGHDPDPQTTAAHEPDDADPAPPAPPAPGTAQPAEAVTEVAQERLDPQRHRTHTVQPDQSLAQVAELHGVSTEALAELNGLDPDLVFAGQVVRLPHD